MLAIVLLCLTGVTLWVSGILVKNQLHHFDPSHSPYRDGKPISMGSLLGGAIPILFFPFYLAVITTWLETLIGIEGLNLTLWALGLFYALLILRSLPDYINAIRCIRGWGFEAFFRRR